jgi:serine/threonine protein phosphatase PrpC
MPYRTASPPLLRLSLAALTDVGRKRMHNEDDFLVFDLAGEVRLATAPASRDLDGDRGFVLAVIDGMGGASSGDAATRIAAETLHRHLTEGPPIEGEGCLRRLGEAMSEASAAIRRAAAIDRWLTGSGAAATVALIEGDRLHLAHAGDTRAYVLRRGRLAQVTRDHSLINFVLDSGALTVPIDELPRNVITCALGMADTVDASLSTLELREGDQLLLCSDGLSGELGDEAMERILVSLPHPAESARALVDAANRAGGSDNITAVLAKVSGDGLRRPRDEDALENRNAPRPKA